jgi:predicted DNA-binding antitoxin AbrB/MazE fold protein
VIRNVKARFSKGVLIPLERLDLDEGENVILSVVGPVAERSLGALRATAGAWKGTHDPVALKEDIYSCRLTASRPQPKL